MTVVLLQHVAIAYASSLHKTINSILGGVDHRLYILHAHRYGLVLEYSCIFNLLMQANIAIQTSHSQLASVESWMRKKCSSPAAI